MPARGASLPDALGPWRLVSEDVTPLQTASEDLGQWTRRVYAREAPRRRVEVNLMEGKGPGPLRVPAAAGAGGGVMDEDGAYRVLDVAGRRAILERHPLLAPALAVAVSPDTTLTLEGSGTDEAELLDLAGLAVSALER